jgi:hypothetical protein
MTPEQANALIAVIARWVDARSDLRGLALCGSWARGDARVDSDLDLVVLSAEPDRLADQGFLPEIDFPGAGFQSVSATKAHYGAVWSWHIDLHPSADVELTVAALAWASTAPMDEGTRAIAKDALRILVDKDELLKRLLGKLDEAP